MCEKCTRMVELLEQTRSGHSWVEASFPYGEARLMVRDNDGNVSDQTPPQD